MKIACIQMNSQDDWKANMQQALTLVMKAAQAGAKLIALPENVLAMVAHTDQILKMPLTEMRTNYTQALKEISEEYKCSILAGTLPFPVPGNDKQLYNRAYMIAHQGVAVYDKIHLCDITLPDGQALQESLRYKGGEKIVVAETEAGKVGLTTCYDVRFPQLFRTLAQKGAEIIAVPSAFTKATGEAHWHTLLRARAIENGCYIIAPAQVGDHPGGRKTFGHSLIVDPWGTVLADRGTDVGIVYAEYDREFQHSIRQKIPSLQHDRPLLA